MQSIQRVASLWVSSPLKPCRWTPVSFAPQAGYAKLGALFRAAHVTLGDHVDFVDRLGVVPDTVGSPVFLAVDIIPPYRPAMVRLGVVRHSGLLGRDRHRDPRDFHI